MWESLEFLSRGLQLSAGSFIIVLRAIVQQPGTPVQLRAGERMLGRQRQQVTCALSAAGEVALVVGLDAGDARDNRGAAAMIPEQGQLTAPALRMATRVPPIS